MARQRAIPRYAAAAALLLALVSGAIPRPNAGWGPAAQAALATEASKAFEVELGKLGKEALVKLKSALASLGYLKQESSEPGAALRDAIHNYLDALSRDRGVAVPKDAEVHFLRHVREDLRARIPRKPAAVEPGSSQESRESEQHREAVDLLGDAACELLIKQVEERFPCKHNRASPPRHPAPAAPPAPTQP